MRNNVQDSTTYDVRVDYHFNSNNLLFAKYIINDVYTVSPGAFPITSADGFAVDPQTGNGLAPRPSWRAMRPWFIPTRLLPTC